MCKQIFLVKRLSSGSLICTVNAKNRQKAVELCERKGIDFDDNFIETAESEEEYNKLTNNSRLRYIDEDDF